ncbi:MAG: hypothetical protein J6A57_05915 [Ruminococcus sp.]|nr:hypothetical protein [Ruminococcus sp.]
MKRRLKGGARYIPGCLYAFLISLPFMILYGILVVDYFSSTVIVIISFIVVIAIYSICLKAGEKIFDFTERKYLERCSYRKKAHTLAEITEFSVVLVIILLATIVPVIIENNTDITNSLSISESINGWD